MRRQAVVWEAVSTICGILAQALVGSVFLAGLGAAVGTVSVFVTAMLGGCTADGISRSAAKQAATALGVVIPILVFVPGTQVLAGVLTPVAAILGAYSLGRAPSADDVGELAAAAAAAGQGDSPITPQRARTIAAAAATALGATTGGTTVAKTFRPQNSLFPAASFTSTINGDGPLNDVGAIATVLLKAAQTTAEVRGARYDLRPDLTRQVSLILDDLDAYRVHVGGPAALLRKWDNITKTTRAYLEDILRSPMPSPWSLEGVVEVLNDPLGAVTPIDGGDRVPVVDVIDRGRGGGGGGAGAGLGLGLLALLALAGR